MSGTGSEARRLRNVEEKRKERWGINRPLESVEPSHFPAFTDRIIYWAPEHLAQRLSWNVQQGGYQVIQIGGSDPRPVTLEAQLQIDNVPLNEEFILGPISERSVRSFGRS